MGKVAFVFSGQGDQHPGMGEVLYRKYPAARAVFSRCDALRPGTSSQCFSGSAEELRETQNTQPCMFAMETAAAAALESCGLVPDMAAGFSLGELAALTAAGAMTVEAGFSLVCRRGVLMQQAAERQNAVMAAVLKLSAEEVEAIAARHEDVYPVNYNCPGQISVSGLEKSMAAFCAEVKAAGGRTMPLKVRGGFHSPFMKEAGDAFAEELRRHELRIPDIPVYSDVTGLPYEGDIAGLFSRQICAPVQWERIIRNMHADGATVFVEIGPGKTLCGMISRIVPGAKCFAVSACENLEALCAEVAEC